MPPKKKEDKREAMNQLKDKLTKFKPAKEVLTKVRAVPTILPQLNIATRVGGFPIERSSIIQGPPGNGKTQLLLAVGKSFLQQGHVFGLIDAEYTTSDEWIRELFGELADSDNFFALRPLSYEETIEGVRELVRMVKQFRDAKFLSEDSTALIGVDSIAKLIPADTLEKLQKDEVKDGVDGRNGRGGQLEALYNARWFKELTPLLYHTKTALAAIGREVANPDAQPFQPKYKLSGGTHMGFESSLTIRVVRESYVSEGDQIVGECHLCTISKSKVAGKDGKVTEFRFHTLNNPSSFDIHRDVIQMGKDCKIIDKKAGHHYFGGELLGRSEAETVRYLRERTDLFDKIKAEAESKWSPIELDE